MELQRKVQGREGVEEEGEDSSTHGSEEEASYARHRCKEFEQGLGDRKGDSH